MATLSDIPPITYVTERFAICEWSERVLRKTHGATAQFLGILLVDANSAVDRLYDYAKARPETDALLYAIQTFETYANRSEVSADGRIKIPIQFATNLATLAMHYARH